MGMKVTRAQALIAAMPLLAGGLVGRSLIAGRAAIPAWADTPTIRVGYFPNITHAQAVLGFGDGTFSRDLAGVTVKGEQFNAGPDELNAIFAGAIDLAYIGPGPAINGYARSNGALRVVAGAATGGSLLIARAGSAIRSLKDLAGKRVAIPQLGNTQDILLRALLHDAGLAPSDQGGSVRVIAVQNPDTLPLFQRGDLDAALVPEPWGSRLIASVGARVVLDSSRIYGGTTPSTVVVASSSFLSAHPDLVVRFLRAHADLTRRLTPGVRNAAVVAALNAQIKMLTGKALPAGVLAGALSRVSFTTAISQGALGQFARFSVTAGYLRGSASITGLIDPWPLAHLHDSSIK